MRLSLLPVALALAAIAALPAIAQHKHAHPLKSLHGGEVLEGRRHHFELVLLPAAEPGVVDVTLHVRDHRDRPSKLEAASGEAVFAAGGATTRVPLALEGGGRLRGAGRVAADPKLEARVTVRLGQLPPETLVFRPLAPRR